MIYLRIKFLVFIFLISPSFVFSQEINVNEYETCMKAMDLLRNRDASGFTELIDQDVLKNVDKESLNRFVIQASQILTRYENPSDKLVLLNTTKTRYEGKNVSIRELNFPFPPRTKRTEIADQYMLFHFCSDINKDKIVGFRIRDYAAPGKQIEDEAKSKQHLERFEMSTDKLLWMRLWYDRGPSKNSYGNEAGVYALSGDVSILKTAKIEAQIKEIFGLINSAKIDSTSYEYTLRRTIGSPEYVYLRMRFNNNIIEKHPEFSIFTIIQPEPGIKEKRQGYIVINHSRVFKYFLKIENNQELFNRLVELAHDDYGNLLEREP